MDFTRATTTFGHDSEGAMFIHWSCGDEDIYLTIEGPCHVLHFTGVERVRHDSVTPYRALEALTGHRAEDDIETVPSGFPTEEKR